MNKELLKSLEDQCYGYAGFRDDTIVFNHEKFAELIVRECCNVFVELRTSPADLAVLDVKKHFGVE